MTTRNYARIYRTIYDVQVWLNTDDEELFREEIYANCNRDDLVVTETFSIIASFIGARWDGPPPPELESWALGLIAAARARGERP
jgi:hypothetical protein